MASFPYRFEAVVPAPRDVAFSWWTHFAPDDHSGDRHLRGTRSGLARSGNEWTWIDEYTAFGLRTRWKFRVRIFAHEREDFHGSTVLGEIRGTISFADEGNGTRVREEGVFKARGFGRLLLPFLRSRLLRLLEADFRDHWADFERGRGPA